MKTIASPIPSSTRHSSAAAKEWTNAKPSCATVSSVRPKPSSRLEP